MEFTKLDIKEQKIDKTQFEEAAYMLKALANEIRLSVISLLSNEKEKSVSELMEIIDCEQSLLSYHLTDMRAKGILNCRRSGKNCFYSIKNAKVIQMLSCIVDCN
ncbi:MAG: ArsR/SmtB family transcription factor [Petrimonas sp.]|jgi:ArsR family transcriptional regulator|nr:MAG: Transcriptional repressor PagR [Bacteroidetes bacterium ADurb.BinA174]